MSHRLVLSFFVLVLQLHCNHGILKIDLFAFCLSFIFFFFRFDIFRYVETESEKVALENKLSKLQADQALWQDIFLKNAELENELKKEKEWRVHMQASNETTNENVTQLSKDLIFYKKVANVSRCNILHNM